MALKSISNSCRFNDDDSAHTARTLAASDGTLWTFSTWVKRGNLSAAMALFSAGSSAGAEESTLRFTAGDVLQFEQIVASSVVTDIVTDAVFRDPTAWYHIVVAYDSDQAASADRITITVNGVVQTFVETNAIDSGRSVHINENVAHSLGRNDPGNDEFFDGYFADTYFIDGSALAATVFGEVTANSSWQPITASPTFSTNGFQFDFTVAPTIGNGAGTDVSGNANHFTDSGLAINDQHTDSPSNNSAVLNPLDSGGALFSDGNRVASGPLSSLWRFGRGTIWAQSGKWYYEYTVETRFNVNELMFGWSQPAVSLFDFLGFDNFGWGIQWLLTGSEIRWGHNSAFTSLTDTGILDDNDVVGVAIDIDAGKIWFRYNGTWLDSGDPGAGTNEIINDVTISDFIGAPTFAAFSVNNRVRVSFNADDLVGSIPTGFSTFEVTSLADPAISDPTDHFEVVEYAGNGTNPRSFSSLTFSPDIGWVKAYDGTPSNLIGDRVRGGGIVSYSASNAAETAANGGGDISAYDAAGFTVDAGGSGDDAVNDAAFNYVAYMFNEDPIAGIDIVTWTGDGSPQTLAHSLDNAPGWITAKRRDGASTWFDYFEALLSTASVPVPDPETDYLAGELLNAVLDSNGAWNDVAPTATQFTVGVSLSTNTATYFAYLFEPIEGFSYFGSYKGNGSTSGRFVWTGFRPKFLMIKRTDGTASWVIFDSSRSPINPRDKTLLRDLDNAQGTNNDIDFLANGFVPRAPGTLQTNLTNAEYIFMAFAEMPFKWASMLVIPPTDGAVVIAMSVAGIVSQPKAADGAVTASLSVAARAAANGAVTATMSVASTGTNATVHASGAVTLLMSVAAQTAAKAAVTMTMSVAGQIAANAAVTMTASVAATGFIKVRADGVLTLTMSIAGTIIIPNFGRPTMTMSAVSTGTRRSLIVGTSVAVPVVATNGIGVNSPTIDGPNLVIPILTIDGVIDNGVTANGNLLLPDFTLDASMAGDGDIAIPVPQITATMVSGRILTGAAIPIPRISVDGILAQDSTLFGSVRLVDVKTNGVILTGAVLSASLGIPNPQVNATITAGQVLSTPVGALHSISGTRNTGAKFCPPT